MKKECLIVLNLLIESMTSKSLIDRGVMNHPISIQIEKCNIYRAHRIAKQYLNSQPFKN